MKRFMSVAITIFALSTNLSAATQRPAQLTESDVVALQSTLSGIFPQGSAAHATLTRSFQELFALSCRELDQETFTTEVNRIANHAAEKFLQQGIDIEKLRAFAQNPISSQFVNALIEKYKLANPNHRKSIRCQTAKIYFYVSLEALISLAIVICFVSLLIQSTNKSPDEAICEGFNPPQSCPCYDLTTFARPTEECMQFFLKSLKRD